MKTATHAFFYGHTAKTNNHNYHVFSQFFPCTFTCDDTNVTYNCAEQWMMSEKAKLFGDLSTNQKIMKETIPQKIKELGRTVANFDEAVWNEKRYNLVVKGNLLKFSQNEDLQKILHQTGTLTIVEASPYDKIWGIGLSAADAMKVDPSKWPGQNLLGKALMEVRTTLQDLV